MESCDQVQAGAMPEPTPETRPFWEGTKAGRLMLPWCRDCGQPHFYPRSICPHCLSRQLEWRQASGRGRLHSYVINHRAAKGFTAPYVIAIVELEEGPRMMSNLVTDKVPTPDDIAIDMDVEIVFETVSDTIALPRFRRKVS